MRRNKMGETGHTKQETLEGKFKDYKFRIQWDNSEPYDPDCEMIDVVLTIQDGQEYWANFTTLRFLQYMFEKNKRTGELLSGTYFCMPDNMVIIKRLTEGNIRATIDNLIKEGKIERYFRVDRSAEMGYNVSAEGAKHNVKAFDVHQRPNETDIEYCQRLVNYYCNLISTISAYEFERELDRFREIHPLSRQISEGRIEDDTTAKILSMVAVLQAELENYQSMFSQLSGRREVRKKLADLASLL
jgi:hypothetical protein